MTSEKLNINLVHPGLQPPGLWQRLTATLGALYARVRQREALAALEPEILRDLGLSEADVWREVRKPSWRP